jgi:hypothetical protein
MYSSRDGHGVSSQPRLVVLKWNFSFLLMEIFPFHIFEVGVKLFFFLKVVGLGDFVDWRLGY